MDIPGPEIAAADRGAGSTRAARGDNLGLEHLGLEGVNTAAGGVHREIGG
jgi:hypothetical protein